jgi:hypothetical protein
MPPSTTTPTQLAIVEYRWEWGVKKVGELVPELLPHIPLSMGGGAIVCTLCLVFLLFKLPFKELTECVEPTQSPQGQEGTVKYRPVPLPEQQKHQLQGLLLWPYPSLGLCRGSCIRQQCLDASCELTTTTEGRKNMPCQVPPHYWR